MDNRAVALVLDEIGTLMDLQGGDRFRARAFHAAARSAAESAEAVAAKALAGELEELPGFGPATAAVVRELVETGGSRLHHRLREETPEGMFELLAIPGVGPRRIHTLYKELGIESLESLEAAIAAGKVAELRGFGAKTQERLLEGLGFVRAASGRRRQPDAFGVAEWLVGLIEAHPAVRRVALAGQARRRMETIDRLDFLAAADEPEPVLAAFQEMPGVARAERLDAGCARARLADGLELRLRCTPPAEFAAAWVHETGSDAHVAALAEQAAARGLRLDARGLWRGQEHVPLHDEADLYAQLGLAFVEPELREGMGELEAAADGRLPRLVTYHDLRGTFHCHTTHSDGKASVWEMAEAAKARGWRYLGIADHSKAAHYAGGLTPEQIDRQQEEIDGWNAEHGEQLWLFKGVEADILPDGRLDYTDIDEDYLARFDYVVGSVHSAFGMPEAEMTRRVVRALENPYLTFLGHPTGRLLLARDSYKIDLHAVIDAAAEHGKAIEINSNPRRLELDWRLWRTALQKGIRTAVNPDAHSAAGLGDVIYGVHVARKGWVAAAQCVNTWELAEVQAFFGVDS